MSVSRKKLADAIRVLSMDSVQRANSGHPGGPMGLADVMEVLWRDFVKQNPTDPNWLDRDRFVLSNGHCSMLLYSALHLSGFDVSISDLKDFRQLGSKTAGHPEFGECPGIETTTGPLGQGLANAVGMALAEQKLAAEFNEPNYEIVDHRTWVVVGDGCLMEGISHEAASLAGTLRLSKLIALYDQNGISIDGEVEGWFTEDVAARFESYGWRVISDVDGHNSDSIAAGLKEAAESDGRPTLVCFRTKIGFGSPHKEGTAGAHGSALGEEEVALTRKALDWDNPAFEIDKEIYEAWDGKEKGQKSQNTWEDLFEGYVEKHAEKSAEFIRRMKCELSDSWEGVINQAITDEQSVSLESETRKSSQKAITILADAMPELFGGSADLTGSNNTKGDGNRESQHINYGVREFAMTAMTNGMLLHGGFRPYSGTFLVFMEYARNAVRLAALMKIPNIFVYTHDSVMVGEDGPTHQPVEQLTNLRTTPNLSTWRPCDTVETLVAWKMAIKSSSKPTALVFSRQKLPAQSRTPVQVEAILRGGYVLHEPSIPVSSIVVACGSEVQVAVEAASRLETENVGLRVVSMPCVDRFVEQDKDYQDSILPPSIRARVAVEAAHPDYWRRFVGLDGAVVGIDRYGVSAPGKEALTHLGVTVDAVVEAVRSVLG